MRTLVRRPIALVTLLALPACGDAITNLAPAPYPPPSLYDVDPPGVTVGAADFTLDLNGADFVEASRVRWNGQDRPTTYVNGALLRATIRAADVDTAGPVELLVYTPPPGGGVSGVIGLTVVNPPPVITGLAPAAGLAPSDSFTLRVTGTGFVAGAAIVFDGFHLFPTVHSAGELRGHVPAFMVQSPRFVPVRVVNPAPGGGTSAPDTFALEFPVPILGALSPESTYTGSAFALTVLGERFAPQAVVRWNGSARATTFISATRLQAAISAADVATSQTATVTVVHPAPGGGTSTGRSFRVRQAPPRITGVSPATVTAGSAAFTLTLTGANLLSGAVVQWNGTARPTTAVSGSTLHADIGAADVSEAGTAQVTVLNVGESGASTPFAVPILPASLTTGTPLVVGLPSNDLAYDTVRGRLWASVPGSHPTRGNTVTSIDPATGDILVSIVVGSEPGPLAFSGDGAYLYVGLRGAPTVVRVDLANAVRDIDLDLGTGSLSALRAEDLVVLPGLARSVAVSRSNTCCSPRHEGVAIYDDGVRRSATTQGHTGSNRITGSATAARLYGYNNETTEFGFRTIAVTPSGLVEETVRGGLISGFGVDIAFDGGLVYTTTGALVDPEALSLLGTFPASGLVRPDAAGGRVHFFDGATLRTYHYRTFGFIGSSDISGGSGAATMIRWGSDGLAFRTGSEIVIVRGSLIGNP